MNLKSKIHFDGTPIAELFLTKTLYARVFESKNGVWTLGVDYFKGIVIIEVLGNLNDSFKVKCLISDELKKELDIDTDFFDDDTNIAINYSDVEGLWVSVLYDEDKELFIVELGYSE